MTREPTVLLAQTLRPWARDLYAHVVDHGGLVLRGYALTAADAIEEEVDVLVVDDVTSFVTPHLVDELHRRGRLVVGLFEPGDGDQGRWLLLGAGVDSALDCTSPPELVIAEVVRLTRSVTRATDGLADGPTESDHRGRIVSVGSAGGGGGATEVALAMSTMFAGQSLAVVIVDADDQSPGLALRLDIELTPNLRTAIDAVIHRLGTIEGAVQRCEGIDVLAGIASPSDWVSLRPAEVVAVLESLATEYDVVVANVGGRVEALPGTGPVARFGVARAVVATADVVVVVTPGSPTGIRRVVDWAVDAAGVVEPGALYVLMNRHGGGRFARAELGAELAASLDPAWIGSAPLDRRIDKAAWRGVSAESGPFAHAVRELVRVLGA